jgi:acyl phosphate:glycerol-3-phosphate acyltransferase
MLDLLVIIAASYLLGSFPTGIIAGKLSGGIDIRARGSGNTGATNSFRVLGWKAGSIVALVDMAKGYVAVAFIARLSIFQSPPMPDSVLFIAATLSSVLGHIKPVFAGFKGGKGFGTAAGAITAAYPALAPLCLGVFMLVLFLTGYVAVCAAVTTFALPFFYLLATRFFGVAWDPVILGFFVCAFLLVFFTMRKKLILYVAGKAELFTKVMVFKPKRTGKSGTI